MLELMVSNSATLQVKNGLSRAKLQALPILNFVLLPIFNCNAFLLQCSSTIWHIASLVPRLQRASQTLKHSKKKTVIPTTTTIPLLQYKNCQKHT
jgi:predicted membrane channel-forming protein YqfA (hemolysin III family)